MSKKRLPRLVPLRCVRSLKMVNVRGKKNIFERTVPSTREAPTRARKLRIRENLYSVLLKNSNVL